MANVLGALIGRDASTGEALGAGGVAAAGIGALVDMANGPAPSIDISAGRAALSAAMKGEFKVMAGAGAKAPYRAAANLSGNAGDWAYVTSKSVWTHQGHRYQAHWAVNAATGQTANAKLKYLGPE